MSAVVLGPWEPLGETDFARKASDGAIGCAVYAPGDADAGRWGWGAINERGHSLDNEDAGEKAPSEAEAKRLADEAAVSLGMVLS